MGFRKDKLFLQEKKKRRKSKIMFVYAGSVVFSGREFMMVLLLVSLLGVKLPQREDLWQPHFPEVSGLVR